MYGGRRTTDVSHTDAERTGPSPRPSRESARSTGGSPSEITLFAAAAAIVPSLGLRQEITGPLVNAMLLLAVGAVGIPSAMALGALPSIIAIGRGTHPLPLLPMVPSSSWATRPSSAPSGCSAAATTRSPPGSPPWRSRRAVAHRGVRRPTARPARRDDGPAAAVHRPRRRSRSPTASRRLARLPATGSSATRPVTGSVPPDAVGPPRLVGGVACRTRRYGGAGACQPMNRRTTVR